MDFIKNFKKKFISWLFEKFFLELELSYDFYVSKSYNLKIFGNLKSFKSLIYHRIHILISSLNGYTFLEKEILINILFLYN